MQPEKFFTRVQDYTKISDREKCKELCNVVFDLLSKRLTENESRDLWSQLPSGLKKMWKYEHGGKVQKMHLDEFINKVKEQGGLSSPDEAELVIKGIFRALKEQISIGETGDVTAQLPGDMKDLWGSA